MSPRKKSNKVVFARNLIIGGVLAVIVLVIGYGLLYTTGVTQGEFVAGEHYEVLDGAVRRRPGSPVMVQEFFSYGCVHCKDFDPLMEQWLETMPDDVSFERVPVAFSPPWVLLAQAYYALETLQILEQNHSRLFRRIHDNRLMFASAEEIAEFVDGNGASAEEFLAAFRGPEVRRRVREADSAQRRVGISAVPTLVVDGRYVVTMSVGRKVALEVVDHLIALERTADAQPAAPAAD